MCEKCSIDKRQILFLLSIYICLGTVHKLWEHLADLCMYVKLAGLPEACGELLLPTVEGLALVAQQGGCFPVTTSVPER